MDVIQTDEAMIFTYFLLEVEYHTLHYIPVVKCNIRAATGTTYYTQDGAEEASYWV